MKPLLLAALAIVGCGSNPDPTPAPTPPETGDAGAPSVTPRPPTPTAEELGCVQTESDVECRVEASSACRAGEEYYLNRGCACDPMRCAPPALDGYPGACCRAE